MWEDGKNCRVVVKIEIILMVMFNWDVLIIMLLKSIFIYIYKILCGFYYYLMVYCYNI